MSTPGETHVMVLSTSAQDGTEEWSCTRCSRRMTVRWSPSFERVVLDRGDEGAPHAGAKGGLGFGGVTAHAAPPTPTPPTPTDDEQAWLAGLGVTWDDRRAG